MIPAPKADIPFESLPWNLNCPTHHNYLHITTTSEWDLTHYNPQTDTGSLLSTTTSSSSSSSNLHPYATSPTLTLPPATTSLNYGTTIWEGLKCYRISPDNTRAAVFRPQQNWIRFCNGARALRLPPPSYELFMRSIQMVIQSNACLIPPFGEGMKLYVRPMLLGTGEQLGLYPSKEFSLVVYVSPTGSYFKKGGGGGKGLNLKLEMERSRAARGGLGNVKCSGNYAVTLRPLGDAKEEGFDDVLYLDLETFLGGDAHVEKAVIQEMSAANVFLVMEDGEIVTPSLDRGTILPGVTRDSILKLAAEYKEEVCEAMRVSTGNASLGVDNIRVVERDVKVGDIRGACEMFVTGTAAEVVPVASVSTKPLDGGKLFDFQLKHGTTLPGGPVTSKLLDILREVMIGKRVSHLTKDWILDPFDTPQAFRGTTPPT